MPAEAHHTHMRQHLVAALAAIGLPYAVASVALILTIIGGEVAAAVLMSPAGATETQAVRMDGIVGWVIPGVATVTALVVGRRLPRHLRADRAPATVTIIAGALATVGVTLGPLEAITLAKAAAPAVAVVIGYWTADGSRRE